MVKTAWKRLMRPAAVAIALLAWNAGNAWSQTSIYYSVGSDTAALYSNTASAVTGTLTLTSQAANKIGVGDEIRHGANRYYITGRSSPTQFTIQNSAANGGTPGNTNITFALTAITIFRAFNTLTAAESGSSDPNHLNTLNLVPGGGFQLNWTCYNDSAMNDGAIVIDGWTTSATRYIRIYTPTGPTEVGVSQRHTGIAGTGFRLVPTADAAFTTYTLLRIMDDHVRIEGVEFDGSNVSNDRHMVGIRLDATLTATSQPHLDTLLIHDLANINDVTQGDVFAILAQNGSARISNSFIYHLDLNNDKATSEISAIRWEPGNTGTSYVHNLTIYDVKNPVSPLSARGIDQAAGTVIAKNVVVLDVVSTFGTEACFFGAITQSNNVSSDATASGPTNQTSYASYFVSVTPGSENLHLRNNSNVLWSSWGADLDADPNLPITDDIDGEPRGAGNPDIGADEAPPTTYYRSIGTRANDTGTLNATQGSNQVQGAGTSWMANNRGRGDRIDIGGTNYTVLSVESDTELTLTDPFQAITGPYAFTIARKFGTLQAWEACISNTTVVLPQCHDVFDASLIGDRSEVGIAYADGSPFTGGLIIDGAVTDAGHTITLTADGDNRHYGIPTNGVVIDNGVNPAPAIRLLENYATVEWMEIKNGSGGTAYGIQVDGVDPGGANRIFLRNNLIHVPNLAWGIALIDTDLVTDVYNNIIYSCGIGIRISTNLQPWTQIRLLNNTLYNNVTSGINSSANVNGQQLTLRNNLAASNGSDYALNAAPNGASSHNLSTDPSATFASPGGFDVPGQNIDANVRFVNRGAFDLHIQATSAARNQAVDLSPILADDADGAVRSLLWDIGADEVGAGAPLSISSATSQSFFVGSPPQSSATITVAESLSSTTITAGDDLRLRIPDGFPMKWDPAVSSVSLGGLASSRVDTQILGFERAGRTVVLDVLSDFAPGDTLTVSGLGFYSFTSPANPDNLELEVFNAPTAIDDKAISVVPVASPSLSSDEDQTFVVGASAVPMVPLTISEGTTAQISSTADLRVRIPASFNMTWDASDTSALITGPGAVSSTVSYEDSDRTLVIDVTAPFNPGDFIIVSGLSFANFAASPPDQLELEVDNLGSVVDVDDKTIEVIIASDVSVLAATATDSQVEVEWVFPDFGDCLAVRIVRDTAGFPGPFGGTLLIDAPCPGSEGTAASTIDTGLANGSEHFYSAYVQHSSGFTPGKFVKARPFDTSGSVKWAYSTGATSMASPGLRFQAGQSFVYVVSNDNVLHGLKGGDTGGNWPSGFKPYQLGAPAQARPPVVSFPVGGATGAAFLASQDGKVQAVDAVNGSLVWERSIASVVQAAPAGYFQAFHPNGLDWILVGTRNGTAANSFQALEFDTGNPVWSFANQPIHGGNSQAMGIISGGASVDYIGKRVFFTSRVRSGGANTTLWALDISASTPDLLWAEPLGNIDGSPIRRADTIYVGNNAGVVHAVDAASGALLWSRPLGDGPIKGFVFPSVFNNQIFVSTNTKVWAIADNVTSGDVVPGWPVTSIPAPSTPLHPPDSYYLLVGSSDGSLYQIDITSPSTPSSVVLGTGTASVGAPTLDLLESLVYVGTDAGIIYGVAYPLP